MDNGFYSFKPLSEPIQITEHRWPDEILPMVHTRTMTYNHESYIRDCIEGILKQKTTFPVLVLIHDDASLDGTAIILREFEERYPKLIKAYYQKENSYSKEKRNLRNEFLSWRIGKYEAICEGDDYWTDPLKLQKQFEFMEANPSYSVCFHAALHYNEADNSKSKVHRPENIPQDNSFNIEDVIMGGGGFMTTNSMLFVKEHIHQMPEWVKRAPVGDLPLMLVLALNGKIGYIDENMSTYRVQSKGSWSIQNLESFSRRRNHFRQINRMWDEFNYYTSYKYANAVNKKKYINSYKYYRGFITLMLKRFKRLIK